jgi:hypothetical protein
VVVLGLLYGLYPFHWWRFTPDSALYVGLGESLAAGRGYVFNGATNVHAFPVFPLLLAPFLHLFGRDFAALNLLVRIFVVGSVPLVFLVLARRSHPRTALPLLAATAGVLSPAYFEWGTFLLTEPLFFLLSFALLLLLDTQSESRGGSRARIVGIAVLTVLTYATRPIAIAAPAAWWVLSAWGRWRRRSPDRARELIRSSIVMALMALCALTTWLIQRVVGEYGYATEFAEHAGAWRVDDVGEWFRRAGVETAYIFFTTRAASPWLGLAPAVFVVIGWAGAARRGVRLLDIYLLFYLLVLAATPYFQDRYLAPVVPLLFYYSFSGVESLCRRAGPRLVTVVFAVSAVLAVSRMVQTWPGFRRLDAFTSFWLIVSFLLVVPSVFALAAILFRKFRPARPGPILVAMAAAFIGAQIASDAVFVWRHRRDTRTTAVGTHWDVYWDPLIAAVLELKAVAPEGATVITRHPRLIHVFSGCIGRRPRHGDTVETLADLLKNGEADYVFIDRPGWDDDAQRLIEALCAAHGRDLRLFYERDGCALYTWARRDSAISP